MTVILFDEAIEAALAQAMAEDDRILIMGEDVHTLRRNLFVRFGRERVRATPISEAAFIGAAVGAAMAGLRPVVEVYMVDFLGVAMDALLNHAAKIEVFSGGRWKAPLVVRAPCGGGYGDGGQHSQSLWGWLGHIPGLNVVVPSNPADAGGLMTAALADEGPTLFLEHKLLSEGWLGFLGRGGRETVSFDVPAAGARGPAPRIWRPLPLGEAASLREGDDLVLISLGVGVHRCLEAAEVLASEGISAQVVDLRGVAPLDEKTVCEAARRTGRVLVVDEDYQRFGLSGEIAAILMTADISARFGRVCTVDTLPFNRRREAAALPNVARILARARTLME
ncbi:MAG: transketolase C-terminal domain-containing protein [Desulfobacterales bacterium]|nr:transketolase C-terminal domain-containing protein [Desulfobacterales bacterium]